MGPKAFGKSMGPSYHGPPMGPKGPKASDESQNGKALWTWHHAPRRKDTVQRSAWPAKSDAPCLPLSQARSQGHMRTVCVLA